MPIPKGLYRHFKGNLYKVLEVAQDSESKDQLVVYQALYGDGGIWARPLSMFIEIIQRDGSSVPRFSYLDQQTEVLEVAILDVVDGRQQDFEAAFSEAQLIVASMPGYISHRLECCIENNNRYILLIEWQTLEDHTIGFRQSQGYQQWRRLLHHFYQPFPEVEHYRIRRP